MFVYRFLTEAARSYAGVMDQNTEPTVNREHVTVVPAEAYEEMLACLDEPTAMSVALRDAARRKREIIQAKD